MPDDTKPQQTESEKQTAVARREERPVVVNDGTFDMLLDTSKFAQLQRIGTMYARSKMVPSHFQGDEPSCMVAVQMAMRLQVDPFMFLQKTYVVGGKPGMEATLAIALINTRGPFDGPIDWDLKRDDKGDVIECTAHATLRATGRVCSSTVTWKMVQAEGWDKKSGSKWLTLREQMFKYRSAAWLGRLYCPEVLMGMAMADELHDEIDVTPPEQRPQAAETTEPTKRRGMRERVIDAAPQEPQREAIDHETGEVTGRVAPDAGAPAVPFEDVKKMAERAANSDQADVILDTMSGGGYTPEQIAEVKQALTKKGFMPAPPPEKSK